MSLDHVFRVSPVEDSHLGPRGALLQMFVVGPCGAIELTIHTDWGASGCGSTPFPVLVRHSPSRLRSGQQPVESCALTKQECFHNLYDELGRKAFATLIHHGSDPAWTLLDATYQALCHSGPKEFASKPEFHLQCAVGTE